jgi:hypothetical protein
MHGVFFRHREGEERCHFGSVLTFIQGAMGPRLREEKPHAEMRGGFLPSRRRGAMLLWISVIGKRILWTPAFVDDVLAYVSFFVSTW